MRQRFNPATRTRRVVLTLLIGFLGLGMCCLGLLSSCIGTATIDTLESDKAALITIAEETLPQIAGSLGGGRIEAHGRWEQGGAKIDVRYYTVSARLVLAPHDARDYIDALEDAGFTITQPPESTPNQTTVAKIDGAWLVTHADDASTKVITLRSPSRTMRPRTPSIIEADEVIEIG